MDELRNLPKKKKELIKKLNMVQQLDSIIYYREAKKKLSAIDNMIVLLREWVWLQSVKKEPSLMEMLHDCGEMEKVTVEVEEESSAYEQMTLFGVKEEEEKSSKTKRRVSVDMFLEDGCFVKCQREYHMNDILLLHDKTTLTDYLKYLIVDVPQKANHKILAQTLETYICEHPLHLLPVLPYSAIKILFEFEKLSEQERIAIDEDSVDDYSALLLWGLLSVQIVEGNRKLHFVITIPKEVAEMILPVYRQLEDGGIAGKQIAKYLDAEHIYTLEELQRYYIEMFMRIKKILTMYGGVEQTNMYQIFTNLLNINCGRDEFFRFIYLFGTFHQLWATEMNRLSKQQFIGVDSDILERIFDKGNCEVVQYYEYENYEELEQTFSEVLTLWDPVRDILAQWELSEYIMTDFLTEYCKMVANGVSLTDVMEDMAEQFCLEQAVDIACLWRQLVIIYQHYPCYLLKGYNRLQAEQEFGVERYYGVFEPRSGKKIAKAMIHELPVELQQKLADMVLLAQQGNFQAVIEQEKNIEGKYLANLAVSAVLVMNLADAYAHLPSREKRQQEAEVRRRIELWCQDARESKERELMLLWCEEKGVYSSFGKKRSGDSKKILIGDEEMGSYYWEDFEPEMKPVVKAEKIYPNDPCPCGSGKKYKKCCGR